MNSGMLQQQLTALEQGIAQVRQGQLSAASFCARLRPLPEWLAALPPRYSTALDTVLTRLESASLFSEESCSFSQGDLLDALAQWVSKARALAQADAT
jgi:hypothetical protein